MRPIVLIPGPLYGGSDSTGVMVTIRFICFLPMS